MLNQAPAFTTTSRYYSTFHPGIAKTGAVETGAAEEEEVVAQHTAIKPSHALCAAYAIQSLLTGLPLLVIDVVISGGSLLLASLIVHSGAAIHAGIWIQLPVLLILQMLMLWVHQLYPGAGTSQVTELRGVVRSSLLTITCLSALNLVLGQLPAVEFVTFAMAAAMISITLPLARWAGRKVLSRASWWGTKILLIGNRNDCVATLRQLDRRRHSGMIPIGYTCGGADAAEYGFADRRLLGHSAEATAVARKHLAPVAGLVSADEHSGGTDRLVFQFPSVVWIDFAKASRNELDTSKLPHVFATRMNMPFLRFMPRIWKRGLDLAICIPGLIVLAIPMAVIALAIKYLSPGPVLYASQRVGQHGKRFKMWKFRSMVVGADKILQEKLKTDPEARREWERDAKLKSDPRIIPGIGHLIRRWSIDELPQIWNVLIGEMSLVGPRPLPPDEIVRYQDHYYEYTQMWPGITGLWQVSGRNDTTFETRVFLVHHYARNWSPWLDFWVLLNTPAVIVSKSGAY